MLRTGTQDSYIRNRINMPTARSHAELAQMDPKIRAQAFFSARVAEAHILDRLREVSDRYSRGEIGLGEARNTLKDFLKTEGYDPHKAGLKNLASTARLNLVMRQNAAMANAAAEWKRMNDPDTMKIFPYVRYHARKDSRSRDGHKELDGKIFHKDDPFLKTHTPPWEFNCRCWLEEITAKEAGRESEKVQEPTPPEDVTIDSASGFSFDPEHAFETFDLASVKDADTRESIVSQMEAQFGVEYYDLKLGWFSKKNNNSPPILDHTSIESAGNETKKILPHAAEVRWTASNGSRIPAREDIVHDVSSINRINSELYEIGRESDLSCVTRLNVEHMSLDAGAKTSIKSGAITLNIDYLNGYDWKQHPQRGGIYSDAASLVYVNKEIECFIRHEYWHARSKELFGTEAEIVTPQMLRNKKILLGLFNRALKEGFNITKHGGSSAMEFFSEIKLREKFDKTSLPDYIINGLKEIK